MAIQNCLRCCGTRNRALGRRSRTGPDSFPRVPGPDAHRPGERLPWLSARSGRKLGPGTARTGTAALAGAARSFLPPFPLLRRPGLLGPRSPSALLRVGRSAPGSGPSPARAAHPAHPTPPRSRSCAQAPPPESVPRPSRNPEPAPRSAAAAWTMGPRSGLPWLWPPLLLLLLVAGAGASGVRKRGPTVTAKVTGQRAGGVQGGPGWVAFAGPGGVQAGRTPGGRDGTGRGAGLSPAVGARSVPGRLWEARPGPRGAPARQRALPSAWQPRGLPRENPGVGDGEPECIRTGPRCSPERGSLRPGNLRTSSRSPRTTRALRPREPELERGACTRAGMVPAGSGLGSALGCQGLRLSGYSSPYIRRLTPKLDGWQILGVCGERQGQREEKRGRWPWRLNVGDLNDQSGVSQWK